MPLNGHLLAPNVNAFSFHVSISESDTVSWTGFSTHGFANYTAKVVTGYTPNVFSLAAGGTLTITSQYNDAGSSYSITYDGPSAPAGGYTVSASSAGSNASFLTSAEIEVRYIFDQIYCEDTGALLKINVSSVEVYVNGSLSTTLSGWTQTSGGVGPAYLPIIGFPAKVDRIEPGVGTMTTPTSGDWTIEASISVTIVGGWRIREGTTWYAFPINVPNHSVPAGSSTLGVNPGGLVSGSDTYNLTTTQYLYAKAGVVGGVAITRLRESKDSYAYAFNEMPRSINRFATNSKEIVYRGDFPFATAQRRQVQTDVSHHPPSLATQDFPQTLYAAQPAKVFSMGDTTHAEEAILSHALYVPLFARHSKTVGDVTETATWSYPDTIGSNISYLSHTVPEVVLWNSWFNPHWSYLDYGENWYLDGSPMAFEAYWFPIRTQFASSGYLDSGEVTNTRTDIIAGCMEESAHTPFLDSYVSGFRWLGLSRWFTRDVTLLTDFTYDSTSAPLWTIDHGSLAFGSGITITFGASTAELALDLGSRLYKPYEWAALATHLLQDWTTTNVSTVKAYIQGWDGTRVEIPITKATKTAIARGSAAKYAGSWAIDNSNGETTDTGVDTLPSGISAATMADARRAGGFGLTPDGSGQKLILVVTPVSSGSTVTINYPRLYFTPSETPNWFWESGQCASFLVPSGPAIRYGNFQHWDPGAGLLAEPYVNGLGYKMTALDCLCWLRQWLLGLAHNDGLTTELTTLFDTFEGQSPGQVDENSIGFPLPAGSATTQRMAIVNTCSEIPPLSLLPWRARNTTTWQPNGTSWVLESWTWTQEPRLLMSTDNVKILKPGTGAIGSSISAPTGWHIWSYTPTLDNSETDWRIAIDTNEFASVRPFHGWFCLLGMSFGSGNVSSHCDLQSGIHLVTVFDTGGNVVVLKSGNELIWRAISTGLSADWAQIRIDLYNPRQIVYLTLEVGGVVKIYKSTDRGETYTLSETVGSGKKPFTLCGKDGHIYIYWQDGSGNLKGRISDRASNIIESTFTVDTGIDDAGVSADESVINKGEKQLHIVYGKGGSVIHKTSKDGKTFV